MIRCACCNNFATTSSLSRPLSGGFRWRAQGSKFAGVSRGCRGRPPIGGSAKIGPCGHLLFRISLSLVRGLCRCGREKRSAFRSHATKERGRSRPCSADRRRRSAARVPGTASLTDTYPRSRGGRRGRGLACQEPGSWSGQCYGSGSYRCSPNRSVQNRSRLEHPENLAMQVSNETICQTSLIRWRRSANSASPQRRGSSCTSPPPKASATRTDGLYLNLRTVIYWWGERDLNPRPTDYESAALTS